MIIVACLRCVYAYSIGIVSAVTSLRFQLGHGHVKCLPWYRTIRCRCFFGLCKFIIERHWFSHRQLVTANPLLAQDSCRLNDTLRRSSDTAHTAHAMFNVLACDSHVRVNGIRRGWGVGGVGEFNSTLSRAPAQRTYWDRDDLFLTICASSWRSLPYRHARARGHNH